MKKVEARINAVLAEKAALESKLARMEASYKGEIDALKQVGAGRQGGGRRQGSGRQDTRDGRQQGTLCQGCTDKGGMLSQACCSSNFRAGYRCGCRRRRRRRGCRGAS